MPTDPNNPPTAAIRDLLTAAFTAEELRRLFLYTENPALRPLTQAFGPNDGLTALVEKTITFCQTRDLLPDLLRQVEKERPRQYARFAGRLAAYRPAPTAVTPAAPPPYFVGREDELKTLTQALLHTDRPQAITALQGMGGIGKTALAQKLAADLADQLPGGVFWADLVAAEGDPLPILAAWGRACGHDLSRLPDPLARADAVRDLLARRLAERGRALVILDDVRPDWLDGARTLQRALPPGLPALITTRQARVAQALHARITRLDLLAPQEARKLLTDRSDGALDGAAAERAAELCGYLPLALELAAAVAEVEGADWLLPRLAEGKTRLDALALDDPARKEESVRLTFDLSYQALAARHPETARAFRCLGAFAPAPVDPARLAGVLAELDRSDGQRALARLLLERVGELPGGAEVEAERVEAADAHLRRLHRWALARREDREEGARYSLHPLLGDYARALLREGGEAEAARAAHTIHYLAYAWAHRGATAADYDALEAEREQILAAMDRAEEQAQWIIVRRFAWALIIDGVQGYLPVRGYWGELRKRLEQAVHAAEAEGEEREAAAFAGDLAYLLYLTGDLEASGREYRRVLAIFEKLGERQSVAVWHHRLGLLAQDRGEYDQARRHYEQSLDTFEELGDRAGIAKSLHQLGVLAYLMGEYDQARQRYEEALTVFRNLGDRKNEAAVLHNLGMLAQARGKYDQARQRYEQSLAIAEELGDRASVAKSLHNLGVLAQARGEYDQARRCYEQSLKIAEELGNRAGIAASLHELGRLAQDRGEYDQARQHYEQSLGIREELGDRAGIATSLHQLGMLAQDRGEYDQARRRYEQSLKIKEELGNRAGIATSLHQLGNLAKAEGDQAEAERLYKQVLALCRGIGDIVTEGIALFNLALLYEDQGRPAEALPLLEQAVEIAEQVGMPVAASRREALERVRGKV